MAHNYYVHDTQGNDNNDGSISFPWKTISKVNNTTLNPGDIVHLNKGGKWHEMLMISGSGDAVNGYITITDYGTGAFPIISGSKVFNHRWSTAYGTEYFPDGDFENWINSQTLTDWEFKPYYPTTGTRVDRYEYNLTLPKMNRGIGKYGVWFRALDIPYVDRGIHNPAGGGEIYLPNNTQFQISFDYFYTPPTAGVALSMVRGPYGVDPKCYNIATQLWDSSTLKDCLYGSVPGTWASSTLNFVTDTLAGGPHPYHFFLHYPYILHGPGFSIPANSSYMFDNFRLELVEGLSNTHRTFIDFGDSMGSLYVDGEGGHLEESATTNEDGDIIWNNLDEMVIGEYIPDIDKGIVYLKLVADPNTQLVEYVTHSRDYAVDLNNKSYVEINNITTSMTYQAGIQLGYGSTAGDPQARFQVVRYCNVRYSDRNGILAGNAEANNNTDDLYDLIPDNYTIERNNVINWHRERTWIFSKWNAGYDPYFPNKYPQPVNSPSYRRGIHIRNGVLLDGVGGNGGIIRENLVQSDIPNTYNTNGWRDGIGVFTGNNVLIELNEITGSDHAIIIAGNNPDSTAIDEYNGTVGSYRVRWNYVHDTGDDSLWLWHLTDDTSKVYGNIFAAGPDEAIDLSGGRGGLIYNNVFYEFQNECIVIWTDNAAYELRTGATIYNNLFLKWGDWYQAPYKFPCAIGFGSDNVLDITDPANSIIDYNVYYKQPGQPNANYPIHINRTQYTFSQWKSAYPQHDGHTLVSDPKVLNAASHNFALQDNSPAINSGLDISMGVGANTYFFAPQSVNIPFDVYTGNMEDYGAGWERGAYIYNTLNKSITCRGRIISFKNVTCRGKVALFSTPSETILCVGDIGFIDIDVELASVSRVVDRLDLDATCRGIVMWEYDLPLDGIFTVVDRIDLDLAGACWIVDRWTKSLVSKGQVDAESCILTCDGSIVAESCILTCKGFIVSRPDNDLLSDGHVSTYHPGITCDGLIGTFNLNARSSGCIVGGVTLRYNDGLVVSRPDLVLASDGLIKYLDFDVDLGSNGAVLVLGNDLDTAADGAVMIQYDLSMGSDGAVMVQTDKDVGSDGVIATRYTQDCACKLYVAVRTDKNVNADGTIKIEDKGKIVNCVGNVSSYLHLTCDGLVGRYFNYLKCDGAVYAYLQTFTRPPLLSQGYIVIQDIDVAVQCVDSVVVDRSDISMSSSGIVYDSVKATVIAYNKLNIEDENGVVKIPAGLTGELIARSTKGGENYFYTQFLIDNTVYTAWIKENDLVFADGDIGPLKAVIEGETLTFDLLRSDISRDYETDMGSQGHIRNHHCEILFSNGMKLSIFYNKVRGKIDYTYESQ